MLTRWALFCLLMWSQYQLWYVHDAWHKWQSLPLRTQNADAKYVKLLDELQQLENELTAMQEDGEWIDTRAREALGMVAEGETLYIQSRNMKNEKK